MTRGETEEITSLPAQNIPVNEHRPRQIGAWKISFH